MGRILRGLAYFFSAFVIAACGAMDEAPTYDISEVYRSDNCGLPRADISLLAGQEQWDAITQADKRFLGETSAPSSQQSYQALAGDALLVLLAAGPKPSPGYAIGIDPAQTRLNPGELELTIQEATPPADTMQAAVMTSPCSIIAIRPAEGINTLRFNHAGKQQLIELP